MFDGVINITLSGNKKYVINIQRPNMQVWLSSPISGPQRFEFNPNTNQWFNIRNQISLHNILAKEFNQIMEDNNPKSEKIELLNIKH